MTYNTQEILSALNTTILNNDIIFYEDKNEDFLDSLGNKLFNGKYKYAFGATKLVILPTFEDFVIKLPYTGSWKYQSGYYSNYYHLGHDEYQDFYGANCEGREWDYCGVEAARFLQAKEEKFDKYFAETKLIGFVTDFPIYIQEKCVPFNEYNSYHTIEEKKQTSKICDKITINLNWLTDFRFYYGETALINFTNFLYNMQWDNDLRDANIGYLNDRPVLIDYAGFYD